MIDGVGGRRYDGYEDWLTQHLNALSSLTTV